MLVCENHRDKRWPDECDCGPGMRKEHAERDERWLGSYEPIRYGVQRAQFIDALIAWVAENPGRPLGELAVSIMEDRKANG